MDDYFKNRFLDLIETIYDIEATEGESGNVAADIMAELMNNGYGQEFSEMLFHVTKLAVTAVYSFSDMQSAALFTAGVLASLVDDIEQAGF